MTKLLVEDTSLTTVADAIRTKGGTTGALTFPDGFVSAIDDLGGGSLGSFIDASITEITADMLKGCTKIINYGVYSRNNLISIVMPDSITYVGQSAFSFCSKLESVTFSKNISSIMSNAFSSCTALTSVVLPDSLTKLQSSAFNGCSKLTVVEMRSVNPPSLASTTFKGCNALTTIKVPSASLNAYKSATNWSAYADKMVGV